LETIRQYGEDRLADLNETETLRARHAAYYAEFAGMVFERIRGPDQIEVGRSLAAELENLHAAMNHAIDSDNVDLALRLLFNTPIPGVQVGYGLFLPAEPVLGLTGAPDHPLYPVGLAIAAWQAALRGDADESIARCEPALAAALRLGDPDRYAEYLVSVAHATVAFSSGTWSDAVTQFTRAAEIARSAGLSAESAINLGAAAWARTMGGDPAGALPLATEGLVAARQAGTPSVIMINLNSLACAVADQDPERAQALLGERRQLGASLGLEVPNELTNTVLTTAHLEDWTQALELASASIRYLHWNNDAPQLGGILNVVARALVPIDAEAAAVLQGAARRLATAAIPTRDTTPASAAPSATTDRPRGGPIADGFITQLRRATSGLLRDNLGEARLRDLRAQGEALDNDHAVAYALDAIDHAI
jgi:hypothetical protein